MSRNVAPEFRASASEYRSFGAKALHVALLLFAFVAKTRAFETVTSALEVGLRIIEAEVKNTAPLLCKSPAKAGVPSSKCLR